MPSLRTGRLRLRRRLRRRLRDEQEPARGPPPLLSTLGEGGESVARPGGVGAVRHRHEEGAQR
ncbi:MAG: hypothetical protein EXR72_24415 [Myxococcales bacterium]|nr:hypothetical protein [Myxococcales bacterium]